ncbi:nuclear transport factor 2 family protein [Micromonospora maritima]|uniref:nuclear transport factor 2 family protein n=1 Tax=Micromonospora maritima TaxID=986711 RepID=UPI00157D62A1|nr:nuclear transport factor 2 family protein [Micromonospora maritima]
MDAIDWSRASGISPDDLPVPITQYLVAHQARDVDAAVARCTPDASVTDEGHTYRGPEQIRDWLSRSSGEYTYTTELVAAARVDDRHFDAVHHLEGDFPGGVADLHFRFTLRDGLIARLVIEP